MWAGGPSSTRRFRFRCLALEVGEDRRRSDGGRSSSSSRRSGRAARQAAPTRRRSPSRPAGGQVSAGLARRRVGPSPGRARGGGDPGPFGAAPVLPVLPVWAAPEGRDPLPASGPALPRPGSPSGAGERAQTGPLLQDRGPGLPCPAPRVEGRTGRFPPGGAAPFWAPGRPDSKEAPPLGRPGDPLFQHGRGGAKEAGWEPRRREGSPTARGARALGSRSKGRRGRRVLGLGSPCSPSEPLGPGGGGEPRALFQERTEDRGWWGERAALWPESGSVCLAAGEEIPFRRAGVSAREPSWR